MRIHMLGICGTGMGSLAILLKNAGHKVTGSDENVYPPMSTQLETAGIKIFQGYKADNLSDRPEMVIIGNVISRGNAEAEAVLSSGIKYLSMPQAVAELFIKEKHSIVVAGTHGKTTTATICAWLISACGQDPSFLIGGVGLNFLTSARIGKSDYFVIEGDEYDTAFFDKGPKFLHYRPKSLLLGPIEFDHADIYKDLSAVMSSFEKLADIMPAGGLLVACSDSDNTVKIAKRARCLVTTYGMTKGADYHPENISSEEAGTSFDLICKGKTLGRFVAPFHGSHNIQNLTGVLALLHGLKFPIKELARGLLDFKGVKRRQEIRGVAKGVTVIDDFAHHPTAIRETISATRSRYPGKRIIAIFEPRSNTSRRKVFQKDFANAFANADISIIAKVHRADKLKDEERLDVAELVTDIRAGGGDAHYFNTTGEIVSFVSKEAKKGDVILVMSNGGFDNIHESLLKTLYA